MTGIAETVESGTAICEDIQARIVEITARGIGSVGTYNASDANEYAQAAIKALEANGFAIVPVEPTKAMIDAGITAAENAEDWTRDSYSAYRVDDASDMPHPVYKAMIAAGNKP